MTTDNRANEPTEAQVKAAWDVYALTGSMRAALVAAQEAAPQAECEPLREALHRAREHFTAIAASGEIRVWEDTGEKLGIDHQTRGWAKRGERICLDALAAPVLPSGTLDVAKIESLIIGRTATAGAHAVAEWLKDKNDE